MKNPLITAEDLYAKLNNDNLKLIDVSVDTVIGKPPIVYDQPICIPNSHFVDLFQDLTDANSSQIHAFARLDQIVSLVDQLDIDQDCDIVIYDNQGIYSSARAW